MYVQDLMTPAARVRTLTKDTPLREAALCMRKEDTGVIPVNDGDKLVGMVTDRDITIRGLAEGKDADTPLSEIMTGEVLYCYADAECQDVVANMDRTGVRRMPVVDREKNFQGMVTLTDLSKDAPGTVGEALADIHGQPAQV